MRLKHYLPLITFIAFPLHAAVPLAARKAGYRLLTFDSNFALGSIDMKETYNSGFQWYLWDFFGRHASPKTISVKDDSGVLLKGGISGPNGQLASVGVPNHKGGFVGVAFGGGAYFEATLAFDPRDVVRSSFRGHPSFWAMSAEHLARISQSAKNAAQSNYMHFAELDIFEYDLRKYELENVYGGTVHDWYGVWKKTCSSGLCSLTPNHIERWVPKDTDFRHFHRYGALWVPATSHRNGYIQFYFDDKPVGNPVVWSACAEGDRPNMPAYSRFCVVDHQHLALLIGTGVGEPMIVKNVRVFQKSANHNIYE